MQFILSTILWLVLNDLKYAAICIYIRMLGKISSTHVEVNVSVGHPCPIMSIIVRHPSSKI